MRRKNIKGEIRTKNSTVGEVEEYYGVKLGVNPNTKLTTFLEKKGYESLARILKKM